jgi:hypothetical protein
MKISEIGIADVVEYLRLEDGWYYDEQINAIMAATKNYIMHYTGLTELELNQYDDIYIAYMVLCQHLYDNRSMFVDKDNVNLVVQSVLDMHRVNFL